MARDGTNRGGRRVRAGDKPAPAAEKIQKGQQVQILKNDIPTLSPTELEAVDLPEGAVMNGVDMPKPSDYLSARQKNGIPLGADEIYKETWLWLKERNCEKLVNPRLIETYAQAFARYIQCEEATSTYGLLGKHPTTGGVITSPFVQMSQQYQKSANLIWYEIYDIVKQNCTEVFEDNPNDTMELLLRARRKG
nr:MAG TPA: terminase small subunit [Caudoviricetes sp.]DAZ46474.1 MAG TPA: terminase small subunit [Caudoviricetes sp.]